MKNGKFIPLGIYNNVKIGYGTVDHKNLKSIYLKLSSWIQPENAIDYDNSIYRSKKKIKDLIYSLHDSRFKPPCIVDLDIRTKGVKLEKRSFMNLEITLFTNKQFDIKEKDVKQKIKIIAETIIDTTLTDKNLYNFHITKK